MIGLLSKNDAQEQLSDGDKLDRRGRRGTSCLNR